MTAEIEPASAGTITHAVLCAVVAANSTDGGETGVVDFDAAIGGMCGAIAMMAQQSDTFPNQRARREFAEKCRGQILTIMNDFAKRASEGNPYPWKIRPVSATSGSA